MELEELQKQKHKDNKKESKEDEQESKANKEESKEDKQESKGNKKEYKEKKEKTNNNHFQWINVILAIIGVIATLITVYIGIKSNEIAEKTNEIAKKSNEDEKKDKNLAHGMEIITRIEDIVTKIQDIYAKSNAKNISTEDKQTLKTIFNSIELIVDNNYSSSHDFDSVKEKGKDFKEVIYRYVYQMVPDLKREVAIGGEDRAELPNTGTLPDLEAAFLAYKHVFMDYLSKYND